MKDIFTGSCSAWDIIFHVQSIGLYAICNFTPVHSIFSSLPYLPVSHVVCSLLGVYQSHIHDLTSNQSPDKLIANFPYQTKLGQESTRTLLIIISFFILG
ncbi:hypothetical protein ACE6H2_018718 [Prunus campanulata]